MVRRALRPALSARSISRHSAREVNMRYGSVVPRLRAARRVGGGGAWRSVGLLGAAARDEVIHQHADVPLVPPDRQRRAAAARERRVRAGDEAEGGGLLVAGRA